MPSKDGIDSILEEGWLKVQTHLIVLLVVRNVGVVPGSVESNNNPRGASTVDRFHVFDEPLVHLTVVAIGHVVVKEDDVGRSGFNAVPGVVGDNLQINQSINQSINQLVVNEFLRD